MPGMTQPSTTKNIKVTTRDTTDNMTPRTPDTEKYQMNQIFQQRLLLLREVQAQQNDDHH